jgi:5-methylcytosine-specific restriction protein A
MYQESVRPHAQGFSAKLQINSMLRRKRDGERFGSVVRRLFSLHWSIGTAAQSQRGGRRGESYWPITIIAARHTQGLRYSLSMSYNRTIIQQSFAREINMPFILCRVVWAETYSNIDEEIYAAKMSNPDLHSAAHERLNFAKEGEYVYGFVERNGSRIALEKLGASKDASEISGLTVIWFAAPKTDNRPRIVGWYENATAYRDEQNPSPGSSRKKWKYSFKAKFEDAHLVPTSQRYLLEVPAKRRRTDKGYIGEKFWFYPETSSHYAKFLESFRVMARGGGDLLTVHTDEEQEGYEEGQRYFVEMMVSARSRKLVGEAKAKRQFNCQACGFNFKAFYGKIGEGFIEAHHKVEINLGNRTSKLVDIDVLCANCHRMVHKQSPPILVSDLKKMIEARKSESKSKKPELTTRPSRFVVRLPTIHRPHRSSRFFTARVQPSSRGLRKSNRGCKLSDEAVGHS